MEKENNTKKYYAAGIIAENFIEELIISINFKRIHKNIEIFKDIDLSLEFGLLIKDILLAEFTEQQIYTMAEILKNGFTTIYLPFGSNRDRTSEYCKVLKQIENVIWIKLNDETVKAQFIAEETKDNSFELLYKISPDKFFNTARDLLNSIVGDHNEKKIENAINNEL